MRPLRSVLTTSMCRPRQPRPHPNRADRSSTATKTAQTMLRVLSADRPKEIGETTTPKRADDDDDDDDAAAGVMNRPTSPLGQVRVVEVEAVEADGAVIRAAPADQHATAREPLNRVDDRIRVRASVRIRCGTRINLAMRTRNRLRHVPMLRASPQWGCSNCIPKGTAF
jgi:hypothetical protein